MMKLWILVFCLFLAHPVCAQDIPDTAPVTSGSKQEKQEPAMELKELVKGQSPLSKRIFFIIDVSGSMNSEGKIGKAVQFVRSIWQAPFDEFEIAIAVFNNNATRWDGIACPKDDPKPCPKGWAKMPSKDAIDAAQKFLNQFPGDGDTYPLTAMEIALTEDRSDLSIVFVTDGDYSNNTQEVLDKIKNLQEAREKKGLGKAVISVFGVGTAEKQANLHTIGKDYLGGFYMEKTAPIAETKKNDSLSPTTPTAPDPTDPDQAPAPSADDDDPFHGFKQLRHRNEHWLNPR